MVRLTVLYGPPADEAEFLSHYETVHASLVGKLDKIERFTWGKGLPGIDGSPAPYFLNAELCWASPDDMNADFGSEAGAALVGDMVNLKSEPTMMMSEGH